MDQMMDVLIRPDTIRDAMYLPGYIRALNERIITRKLKGYKTDFLQRELEIAQEELAAAHTLIEQAIDDNGGCDPLRRVTPEVLIDAIRYLETHWCCNGVCALGPVLAVDPMPSNIRGAMSLWIYLERTSEGWVIHSIRKGLAALPEHEIRRDITMYDGGTKTRWAGTACLPRCF